MVKLYNEAMGGVDLLNQVVSLYQTEIWSKKWTLRMIAQAFDMAVVKSWYRLDAKRANIQTKDIQDLLHFKMNVAQCLVSVHKTVATWETQYVSGTTACPPETSSQTIMGWPLPEVQYDIVDPPAKL